MSRVSWLSIAEPRSVEARPILNRRLESFDIRDDPSPKHRSVVREDQEGDVDQCLLDSVMSRNTKPEFAFNERTKVKRKPVYIGGLKVPTPGNSSFQCWCVVAFTLVGWHCYFTNFPFEAHTPSNILAIALTIGVLYSLWMTWSTHAGTIPERGWVRCFSLPYA